MFRSASCIGARLASIEPVPTAKHRPSDAGQRALLVLRRLLFVAHPIE